MLRDIFCSSGVYNLADPAVEEALYDSATLRQFVGIGSRERSPVPDEPTVCKFRHLLEEHNLGEEILGTVNLYLQAKGVRITTGTIVDATLIHAPLRLKTASRASMQMHAPDQEGQELVLRDEGARGSGQQDQDHPHGGGDGGQMFPMWRCCRTCCMAKKRGCGATGAYQGQTRVMRECAPGARDFTQRRCRYKGRIVDEVAWAKNRTKSKVRARVEARFSGDEAEVRSS